LEESRGDLGRSDGWVLGHSLEWNQRFGGSGGRYLEGRGGGGEDEER
jgi:hypothetical protein